MKIFRLLLALAAATSAQAELFRPEAVSGALLGAAAGAVIGHQDDRHAGDGAAIGAGVGFLLGHAVGEARDEAGAAGSRNAFTPTRSWYPTRSGVTISYGYHHGPAWGYHPRWHRHHAWHGHPSHRFPRRHAGWHVGWNSWDPWWGSNYGWHRAPYPVVATTWERERDWDDDRPARHGDRRLDARWTGTVLGAGLGAIIGHQDDRHGWEGAAIGAGAGWLLGSLAEHRISARETTRQARLAEMAALRQEAEATWGSPAARGQSADAADTAAASFTATPASSAATRPPARPMASANALFGR